MQLIFYALGKNFTSQLFSQERIETKNREFNVIDEVEVRQNKEENSKSQKEKFEKEKKEYFDYKYPGVEECRLSFKNSVTGAMKLNDENVLIVKNDEKVNDDDLLDEEIFDDDEIIDDDIMEDEIMDDEVLDDEEDYLDSEDIFNNDLAEDNIENDEDEGV